jgi:hypothetical protein
MRPSKGPIDKILTCKMWIPLSRLSYGVYLIHITIGKFFTAISEHPIHVAHSSIVNIPIEEFLLLRENLNAIFLLFSFFHLFHYGQCHMFWPSSSTYSLKRHLVALKNL